MHHKSPFVAIDFETADYGPDSACAVALVRVEGSRIVQRSYFLIRPPRKRFVFSYLHNITWEMVSGAPTFGELWPELQQLLADVQFISAHNAPFDRGVLHTCCAAHGLEPPRLPFLCTVQLARQTWKLFPTKLPTSASFWGFPWTTHAASDAEACARIVIAARK